MGQRPPCRLGHGLNFRPEFTSDSTYSCAPQAGATVCYLPLKMLKSVLVLKKTPKLWDAVAVELHTVNKATQNAPRMHNFKSRSRQILWGGVRCHSQIPPLVGGNTPSHTLTPRGRSPLPQGENPAGAYAPADLSTAEIFLSTPGLSHCCHLGEYMYCVLPRISQVRFLAQKSLYCPIHTADANLDATQLSR